MGDQFPATHTIAERTTYYVRPTIQGIATGGVKKFVGSRHAEMTMPIKKSYLVQVNDVSDLPCDVRMHTDTNSLRKTKPRWAAGLAYKAKIPAGPTAEKFSASYRPAAVRAASASYEQVRVSNDC